AAMMKEYRRLLYVALTRAEDRLYICGATSRSKAGDESWYTLVKEGMAGIATPFETPLGEGLRIGTAPQTTQVKAAELSPAQLPASAFAFLARPVPEEPAPPKPLAPSRLEGEEPPAASPLSDAS